MTTPTDSPANSATLETVQEDVSRKRLRRSRRYILGFGAMNVAFYPIFAVLALVTFPVFQETGAFWLGVGVGIPLSLAQAGLVFWIYRLRFGMTSRYRRLIVWTSLIPLVLLCTFYGFTTFTAVYVAFWWGAVFLVASRREIQVITGLLVIAWTVGAVAVLPLAARWEVIFVYAYGFGMTAMCAVFNHAFGTMWDIVQDSHEGRWVRARLAVTEERQRIARDLHDLLGHSLSGMAVKSELAARLARKDPERAAAEMFTVQALARDALREMRATVSNYRVLDLGVELGNVRQVLSAGGTRCTVAGADIDMTANNQGVAAWVVREAATNILRHSSATHCDITLSRQDGLAIIEVFNDGVGNGATPGAPSSDVGNGLRGLRERISTVGGILTAHPTDDGGFLLRALLPDTANRSIPPPTDDEAHSDDAEHSDDTATESDRTEARSVDA